MARAKCSPEHRALGLDVFTTKALAKQTIQRMFAAERTDQQLPKANTLYKSSMSMWVVQHVLHFQHHFVPIVIPPAHPTHTRHGVDADGRAHASTAIT
jgi:hypothetical protein